MTSPTSRWILKDFAVLAVLSAVYLSVIWLLLPPFLLYCDENVHFLQAWLFSQGELKTLPELSTWPVFNYLLGLAMRYYPSGAYEISFARSCIAAVAMVGLFSYWRSINQGEGRGGALKFFQIAFNPLILPYCCLIYTDMPAVCAVLLALSKTREGKWWGVLLFLSIATLLRQSNIIWIIAFAVYFAASRECKMDNKLQKVVTSTMLVAGLWALAVALTGGVAYGASTRADHFLGLNGLSNIYFFVCVWVLVCPVTYAEEITRLVRGTRMALSLRFAVLILIGAVVYFSFKVDHPGNTSVLPIFIRNELLKIGSHGLGRMAFALLVGTGIMAIAKVEFKAAPQVSRGWFWLFSTASVLPFWLIEQRYYIIVFVLLTYLRRTRSAAGESAQLAVNFLQTAVVTYFIASGKYFL